MSHVRRERRRRDLSDTKMDSTGSNCNLPSATTHKNNGRPAATSAVHKRRYMSNIENNSPGERRYTDCREVEFNMDEENKEMENSKRRRGRRRGRGKSRNRATTTCNNRRLSLKKKLCIGIGQGMKHCFRTSYSVGR